MAGMTSTWLGSVSVAGRVLPPMRGREPEMWGRLSMTCGYLSMTWG
ncbi:MAG: hypothetical protein M0013_07090 [Actinomycetota bacterium]|nr:hypothetical protein [Actinomycetota bacterium]